MTTSRRSAGRSPRPHRSTRVLEPAAEQIILSHAERQFGVISWQQLRSAGLSSEVIRRRVAIGQLRPVYRGVYAVGHHHLVRRGELWAAYLAAGGHCVLSHWTAAELNRIVRPSEPAHVLLLKGQLRPQAGLVVHRSRVIPAHDVVRTNGLEHTSVARSVLDCAGSASAEYLDDLLDAVVRTRQLDRNAFGAVMAARPRVNGIAALIAAGDRLNETAGRARSKLERKAVALCKAHGIPQPTLNGTVAGIECDLSWVDSTAIVEIDGGEFHCTPADLAEDARREAVLAAAGRVVHRVSWVDITRYQSATAQLIHEWRRSHPAP